MNNDLETIVRFQEKGRKYANLRKDFNDRLQAADDGGLTISTPAVAEIIRLGVPEVAYYLASPENFEAAHALMNLTDDQQVVQIQRLAKQLEESGFLNDADTEDWIDQRREAKRAGKRR
jgi:hypothetical protein